MELSFVPGEKRREILGGFRDAGEAPPHFILSPCASAPLNLRNTHFETAALPFANTKHIEPHVAKPHQAHMFVS